MKGRASACLAQSLLLVVGCSSAAPSGANGLDSGAPPGSGGLAGSSDAQHPPASGAAGTAGNGAAGSVPAAGGAGAQAGASGGRDGGATVGSIGDGSAGAPVIMGSLTFTRKTLHQFNYAEGIGTGDFNKDGKLDVLSGPFWWEGPDFEKRHQYFPPPANNAYTDKTLGDWADYPYDVDGDGWVDSINVMRPGTPSTWYKNPGAGVVDARHRGVGEEPARHPGLGGIGLRRHHRRREASLGRRHRRRSSGGLTCPPRCRGPSRRLRRAAPRTATRGGTAIGTGDVVAGQPNLLTENAWYSRRRRAAPGRRARGCRTRRPSPARARPEPSTRERVRCLATTSMATGIPTSSRRWTRTVTASPGSNRRRLAVFTRHDIVGLARREQRGWHRVVLAAARALRRGRRWRRRQGHHHGQELLRAPTWHG